MIFDVFMQKRRKKEILSMYALCPSCGGDGGKEQKREFDEETNEEDGGRGARVGEEANLQSPSLTQNANNLVASIHRSNSMAAVACTCIILKSPDKRRQHSTLRTRCQTQ
jgi:hypothetical protein